MSMLALSLILAQASPVVTFKSPAAPLGKVIAAISAQTKVPMSARGPIADEIVVVSVKDASMEEVRKYLAFACTGQWQQDGAAFVLVRDEPKAKIQEQEELARIAERFAKRIQENAAPVLSSPSMTAASAEKHLQQLAKINDQVKQNQGGAYDAVTLEPGGTPQERLMARVLLSLDPKEIASLPADSRSVYSTSPTRMQRQLPNGAMQSMGQFVTEYGIWQAVAERYRPTDPENQFVDFGFFGPMKSRPAKAVLIATKWGDGLAVSFELKIVDSRGFVLASTAAGIDATGTASGKEDGQPSFVQGETPIQLSKDSIEVLTMRSGLQNPTMGQTIRPELRAKLLKPEEFDPLLFGPSDFLLGIAEQEGRNLIASVPDSTFDLALGTTGATPSRARQSLSSGETMTFTDDGKWTVATATWPALARRRAMPRHLLGQLARELEKPGAGSLDALSRMAAQLGGTSAPQLSTAYVAMLQPAVAANLDFSSWDLLRFYGGLTSAQKAAVSKGGDLAIGSLESNAKNALNRLVFFGTSAMPLGQFQMITETEPGSPQLDTSESIRMEPTEAMPDGLPPAGILRFEVYDASVAIGLGGGSFSADDLGTQLAMRERPEVFPYVSESPMPAKFSMAQRRSIMITMSAMEQVIATYLLNDLRAADNRWGALNELPQAFRDAVERSRKDARDAFKNVGNSGAGGGGSNIPPER